MQEFTESDLKGIIARRDRRYDGRFYFGVRTTLIYCRPVCPAKPKPENILIFKSMSEAENQGYRPCLRCRPDLAPGSRWLDGTLNTVGRALRIIEEKADEDWDIESLAHSLGVSGRHLRRLFDEHLGASPIEVMITQRLHFAKKALLETDRPVSEIAFASGFGSLRRFNEAFQKRFHETPSAMRKRQQAPPVEGLLLKIPIRLPYDWPMLLAYLKRHEAFGLEWVDAQSYRRFISHSEGFGVIEVTHSLGTDFLQVKTSNLPLKELRWILARLRKLFDSDHNPLDLPCSSKVSTRGIRVPASFDPFETAVSIILGQLVSTAHARTRLKKLIERYGQRIGDWDGQAVYSFPKAQMLAGAKLEELGLTGTMSGAIRTLSEQIAEGRLDLSCRGDQDDVRGRLQKIKGIGPWTLALIRMRCLNDADAFPEKDLIIQRALDQDYACARDWVPFRAYLTHCLWRDLSETLSKAKGVRG